MPQSTDSDLEQGAAGTPTPKVSETPNDKPNSGTSSEDALVEKLLARLKPEIEKTVQSTKDKRFKQVEQVGNYMTTLESMKSYLDAAGGDVKKAAREMKLDQLLAGEDVGNVQAPQQQTQGTNLEERTAKVLRKAGIDPTDPEVAEMAKKQYMSEEDWIDDLVNLGIRRAKGTPATTPTPPSVVSDARGKTPAAEEDILKKLDKVPLSDSRTFYKMAQEDMRKGKR